ncbi:MAG: PolC-type DNA polymerase III [Clostridia bacterium]|nr:PolC-type DNA polymerase III [Clostridia bacterium]
MSYEDLLSQIYRELPHLTGALSAPRVVYVRAQGKVYITFESSVLVEEQSFLKMERILRRIFPQKPLALRVVSPGLKQDFMDNISAYKPVLTDFLKRNYPASASWLEQIDWRCLDDRITLTFPDPFSMQYMARQNVAARLSQAVKDIFSLDIRVELTVAGDQEKRLAEIRQERELAQAVTYTTQELQQRYGGSSAASAAEPRTEKVKRERKPKEQKSDAERAEEAARAAAVAAAEEAKKKDEMATPQMTDHALGKPIMGRAIADHPIEMKELTSDAGLVVVQGDIFKLETKELKGGEMLLLTFAVTDYTSSILCKVFFRYRRGQFGRKRNEDEPLPPITAEERQFVMDKVNQIKVGMNVRLRGECMYDNFARELSISVRDLVPMERIEREDKAEEKRIELHMHTNMSTMDAMTPAGDLIKRAIKWGHPAVAITDHGVVQAFPAAFGAARKQPIKLIPGCEGYMIDERDVVAASPACDLAARPLEEPIVVLDFESTGLNTAADRVIEIGAVKLVGGTLVDSLSLLVNPKKPLPEKIVKLTGITDMMLADKETAETAILKLMDFIGDAPVAAHNAAFDVALLRAELRRLGREWDAPVIDTLTLSRKMFPEMKTFKLASVCKQLQVSLKNAHRAVHDATATAQCLAKMLRQLQEEKVFTTLSDLNTLKGGAIGDSYHVILLVKTQEGMVNLNRLVTIGHLDYFRRRPHMPKQIIQKHREGLIIGSACEAGELFQAVLANEPWEKLKEIASWYDYLEIQPVGNNYFMVREGRFPDEEALRDLNRVIVKLGEELNIPVVATGDVHFLDPHHAKNRAIIQAGMGFEDADNQAPLYFKTTDEMLEEFAYLGPEKCYDVVIGNPRKIADQVGNLSLFPPHPKGETTFQPLWEDAADNILSMTWGRAHEMYGDDLPDIVTARIEKELKSIIGYGFATLYNIAQKLVKKSNDDGYLVGSRGSVGSSFVAHMCGITEVNALPPHYRCTHCRKAFFDVDKAAYKMGVDLPDKDCPICGKPLAKDGFDIPFEVFLGFEGDKVPDIDLNFSGEYQNRAHHYVEELFGKDHVFRAGTISGLAEKTAYGYVAKYFEERGIQAGNTEKERLAAGCEGVKKTTGQHPGGMVVVPKEYDICQFTAVQHPADDLNSDFTTTHFDFNSMHDILVKLDCLGHVDPTVLHMLAEITDMPTEDVPLDDKPVRSLFSSPEALGVTREDIDCTTGTFGIPEFGTAFVRGMLDDTKPSTMEELVRISGLSHGTDVWLGNAQDLVRSGTAKLSECVCCRDDIMNYLIDKGVAPKMAFTTMESVRKGKGLKPEMEQAMLDANVPAWFMDSCKKIKYMFPKGHAVAYVMSSLRVAWYKVHRPLAYYAAYFTLRGKGFDAATMIADPEIIRQKIKAIKEDPNASAADGDAQTSLELVLEMNMRGFRFLPADLYKSHVTRFLMEDEKSLRVPFTSLGGLGESVAENIVREREKGPFLSIEDLKDRAHVPASIIELLRTHGSLEGMSETSQVSMFF